MRISTNQIYDQNIRSIMDNQTGLVSTQQQLATGKRINSPSDDPVGAAKVLRIAEELDSLDQYQRNIDLFTNALEQQEAVLTNITNSVNRARTLIVQSGSGILTDTDRASIGSELEQIRQEVFDLMNSQDADGHYIYAGFQSGNQAFTYNPSATGNTVEFAGDGGNNFMKLSNSASIQSTTSGQEVFENVLARYDFTVTANTVTNLESAIIKEQGTHDTFFDRNYDSSTAANNDYQITILATGQAELRNTGTGTVVDTVNFTSGEPFVVKGLSFTADAAVGDTIDFSLDAPEKKSIAQALDEMTNILMDSTVEGSQLQESIADALVNIDNGLEKISIERASIGGRLNVAESLYESNLDLEISAKAARSSIEDVDYAEASTEFARQETALNAALASFPQVANLSLFNYI
ncbi:flagellar hook-associated protein FlgL [Alteromonas sp. KUL49]|uniref:flagellar hook-associated protein FlgL n=1 Tax=Alteromonas sp. KUL49 TaxID=2480798 RepID=UPI00102F036F|nr:flagellar hook-associated protein FlgL [Alteromonas sp. KUL49]TAP39658.1 flagellar hook-associated protein 3 [Alteromonas sp. KUL49]GEA11643.1 flagellar hook-associated protein 3 [Alteromonas sp. KUL49]